MLSPRQLEYRLFQCSRCKRKFERRVGNPPQLEAKDIECCSGGSVADVTEETERQIEQHKKTLAQRAAEREKQSQKSQ